jgi:hypothetical protein
MVSDSIMKWIGLAGVAASVASEDENRIVTASNHFDSIGKSEPAPLDDGRIF